MNININKEKSNNKIFEELKCGDLFIIGNDHRIYMKTEKVGSSVRGTLNAVSLSNGELLYFAPGYIVTSIDDNNYEFNINI